MSVTVYTLDRTVVQHALAFAFKVMLECHMVDNILRSLEVVAKEWNLSITSLPLMSQTVEDILFRLFSGHRGREHRVWAHNSTVH